MTKYVAPEDDSFLPETPITDAHRVELEQYAKKIEMWLQDRRKDRVIMLVSMILTAMPHREISTDAVSIKISAFEISLEDMPTWAIELAVRRWLKGEIGDGGFGPTPPQLRQAAQSVAMGAWAKARQAKKLATLPVQRKVSEEERQRVMQLMANVRLQGMNDPVKPVVDVQKE